jgi:hypothetical protein
MQGEPVVGAAERRSVVGAARVALTGLARVLHEVPGVELGAWLGDLDELVALAGAGRVAVTAEAVSRGDVAAGQAGSVAAWVAEHAGSLAAAGGAGQVATVVEAGARVSTRAATEAVLGARVPVPVAVTVLREFHRLAPQLRAEALETVVAGMLTVGSSHGSRGVRELRARLVAQYGAPGAFQAGQDAAAALVSLSAPVGGRAGGLHLPAGHRRGG